MNVSSFLVRFKPTTRGCFLDSEIHFSILDPSRFRYSYENCQAESVLSQVAKTCQCQRGIGILKHPYVQL